MPDTLERAERLRLPLLEIARRAGIDQNTVFRVLKTDAAVRRDKLHAVEAVIRAEEIALRDHLLRLHPVDLAAANQREAA